MPIHFNYDRQLEILLTTAVGTVSLDDLNKHIDKRLLAGTIGCPEIFDATAASTDMTTDDIRKMAERTQRLMRDGPFGPTAVIANRDFTFGMARMFAIIFGLLHGPQFAAFRTVNEGLDWLRSLEPQVNDIARGA